MSELTLIKGLTKNSYIDILLQISRYDAKAKIYKDNKNKLIVFPKPQDASKNTTRLTFKEITYISCHFKDELLKDFQESRIVASALDRMTERKLANQDKRFILMRLIAKICDRVSNLFNGYGFKSTTFLAQTLSKTLKKTSVLGQPTPVPPQPKPLSPLPKVPTGKPAPEPTPTPEPKPQPQPQPKPEPAPKPQPAPQPSPKTSPESSPQPSHMKFKKKDVLKDYYNAPWDVDDRRKLVIFKDIQGMTNQFGLYFGDITTLEHLMKYITDSPLRLSKAVDLNNPKCVQVAVDTFRFCPELVCDSLVNWLMDQLSKLTKAGANPPFNLELLEKSLEVFIMKSNTQQRYSQYSLEQLLVLYMNSALDSVRSSKLPLHNDTIVKAIQTLYFSHPNEKVALEVLTPWLIKQPEYDLNLFSSYIRIFKLKEETKESGNLFYPVRDRLCSDFLSRGWNKDIVHLTGAEDVILYLKIKGII